MTLYTIAKRSARRGAGRIAGPAEGDNTAGRVGASSPLRDAL